MCGLLFAKNSEEVWELGRPALQGLDVVFDLVSTSLTYSRNDGLPLDEEPETVSSDLMPLYFTTTTIFGNWLRSNKKWIEAGSGLTVVLAGAWIIFDAIS